MTRAQLSAFTKDATAALAPVLAKHQVTIINTAGTYGDVAALKFKLHVAGTDTPDVVAFKRFGAAEGFRLDDLGKRVVLGATSPRVYILAGLTPSGKAVLHDFSGKRYTASALSVVAKLRVADATTLTT